MLHKATINSPEELSIFEFPDREILKEQKVLKVTLHTEDKDIYYYTRVVEATDSNVLVCLNYMRDFHEHAIAKAENTGVGKAIEPNEKGNNSTFQHVTINSDYDHVTWGALEPKVQGDVKWNITELNNSYTCVLMEYQVRCTGEENETDNYKVKEYFKVRHSESAKKTYLLAYDREMEQIFDPMRQVLGKKGVILGIADGDLSYMANKNHMINYFHLPLIIPYMSFHIYNQFSVDGISMALDKLLAVDLEEKNKKTLFAPISTPPVVVCVGSDLAVGDSLGPIVGSMLKYKTQGLPTFIYGTLATPITAKEIKYLRAFLKETHAKSQIIAVDAAVGAEGDIGLIKVNHAPLFPGAGANKKLGAVGDISLMGIVAERSVANYGLLNTTRLNLVYSMAEKISDALSSLFWNLAQNKRQNG